MQRQRYLDALMQQPSEWIRLSVETPTAHMTRTHIALHYIALRRRRINRVPA